MHPFKALSIVLLLAMILGPHRVGDYMAETDFYGGYAPGVYNGVLQTSDFAQLTINHYWQSGAGMQFAGGDSAVKFGVENRSGKRDPLPTDLVVYVPRRGRLSVKTVTANVTASDVSGWFYSVSGSLRFSGSATSLEALTRMFVRTPNAPLGAARRVLPSRHWTRPPRHVFSSLHSIVKQSFALLLWIVRCVRAQRTLAPCRTNRPQR